MSFDSNAYFNALKSGNYRSATKSLIETAGATSFSFEGIKGSVQRGARDIILGGKKDSSLQPILIVIYEAFDKAVSEAKNIITSRQFCDEELRTATRTFARWAAVRTPPNAGNATLASSQQEFEKLYYRPILFLPQLLKGNIRGFRPNSTDVEALRNKFLYKVVDTRKGKDATFCYTATKQEALTQARIVNRGLTRAAWGINIHQIGVKEIKEITKLIQESPNLVENAFINTVFYNYEGAKKYVELHNRSEGVKASYKNMIAKSVAKYPAKYLRQTAQARARRVLNDALIKHRQALKSSVSKQAKERFIGQFKVVTGGMVDINAGNVDNYFNNYLDATQTNDFFRRYNLTHEGSVQDRFSLDFTNDRWNFNLR